VDFLVPPQVLLQSVALPTDPALVGSTSGVEQLVFNKVALLREAFPTLGALARPHADVDCLVTEEVGLLVEGLLALRALVGLLLEGPLSCVDALVGREVAPGGEAPPTLPASKELLCRVDPLVSLQV
ncbi:hypothetical protein N337_05067, partial [Phoenicopterus ruber ruber]